MATVSKKTFVNNDERVRVFLPPAPDNEENFVLVGVNGVMIKIQRGQAVDIPKAYKAVLDNASIAYKIAEKNAEKKLSK